MCQMCPEVKGERSEESVVKSESECYISVREIPYDTA